MDSQPAKSVRSIENDRKTGDSVVYANGVVGVRSTRKITRKIILMMSTTVQYSDKLM